MSATTSQPPPLPYRKAAVKHTKWIVLALGAGALVYGWNAGWFEPVPTRCADLSARQLNRIYSNSLLGKMGLQIIDIESATDAGSNAAGLRCKVKTVTTHDEMTFTVSTKTINGQVYIEMVPDLFE